MRTAARDASTRAAAALRSGFRSTASATTAVSSGSPKLRIQFGTTAPLRCGPAHLPGIFARADSGIMFAPAGGFFKAQPASITLLAVAKSTVQRRTFIVSSLVSAEESGKVFDDEPVELRLDTDDHAADELDHRMLLCVDCSLTAGASGEKDVFILPVCKESHCDALFGRHHRLRVRQVPADRQLALCCRPKDGIDLAFDDAARIHLHEDFRFLAGFYEAQLVLPVEG